MKIRSLVANILLISLLASGFAWAQPQRKAEPEKDHRGCQPPHVVLIGKDPATVVSTEVPAGVAAATAGSVFNQTQYDKGFGYTFTIPKCGKECCRWTSGVLHVEFKALFGGSESASGPGSIPSGTSNNNPSTREGHIPSAISKTANQRQAGNANSTTTSLAPRTSPTSVNDAIDVFINGVEVRSQYIWSPGAINPVVTTGDTTFLNFPLTASELSHGFVTIYVEDDTAVTAAVLTLDGCCGCERER